MLIGRADELGAVASLVDEARAGHGQVLVVEGEAGIGKSALLDACAEEARSAGFDGLRGAGDELGATRPFGPLLDALVQRPGGAEAGRALRRLLAPEVAPGVPTAPLETGPGARSLVIDEIVVRVEELCVRGPVALCLDDLHWADGSTVAALGSIVRHAADLPLVVAVALRPLPRRDELGALLAGLGRVQGPAVRRLDLAPLSSDHVEALASDLVGEEPGAGLRATLRRCGGNPLLVVELVDSLRRAGRLTDADDDDELPLPDSFDDAVRERLAGLGEEARTVATLAALLGTRFTLGDLAAVTRRPAPALLPDVRALVDARLLADDGSALSYRHDLLREAVASALPASVRTELHRDIAGALQAAGAPTTRVAEHVALGAREGSSEAVTVLQAAAQEITPHDPTGAVTLLRRALELCPPTDPQHDLLLARLVDALAWSGGLTEAERTAEAVLSRPLAPEAEIGLRSAVSRSLLILGRPAEAVPHEELLVALHRSLGRSTAWTLAESAVCRLFALDLDGALREAVEAVAEAGGGSSPPHGQGGGASPPHGRRGGSSPPHGRRGGSRTDDAAAILGLSVQAFGWVTLGDSARAAELATRAVVLADATPGGEGHRMHPNLFRGVALQSLGRPADAAAAFERGRSLGEALGASWALPIYHFLAALGHWDVAAWDDLLAEVDAGLAFGEERASSIGQVWALGVAGRVLVHRGELARAAELLDAGDRVVEEGGVQYGLDWLALGRALWLDAAGRRDEGLALLRAVWDGAAGLQAAAALVTVGGDLARLAVACGDREAAAAVADELGRLVERSPDDLVVRARERRARGLVDGDAEVLLDAAARFEQVGHAFEVAVVRTEAAALLLDGGDAAGAGALLERALSAFEDVGAVREAEEARALLARARPGRHPSARPRAVAGWEALTTTEREVVDEVCAGRSNGQVAVRLGISRRTVEAHLRSIYRKIGVSTRLALAVALHEQRGGAPEVAGVGRTS